MSAKWGASDPFELWHLWNGNSHDLALLRGVSWDPEPIPANEQYIIKKKNLHRWIQMRIDPYQTLAVGTGRGTVDSGCRHRTTGFRFPLPKTHLMRKLLWSMIVLKGPHLAPCWCSQVTILWSPWAIMKYNAVSPSYRPIVACRRPVQKRPFNTSETFNTSKTPHSIHHTRSDSNTLLFWESNSMLFPRVSGSEA